MKVVSLRGIPTELARVLERKARDEGKSLNRIVIEILLSACGLSKRPAEPRVNHDFDEFVGVWSPSEADDFDVSLAEQRRIDPALWK